MAATAFIAGTTAWSSLSGLPATLKATSADRPVMSPGCQRRLDPGRGLRQRSQGRHYLLDRLPELRILTVGPAGK